LNVNPVEPEPASIDEAAGVIRRGGLVCFPTDTLYGIAADPFNPEAVRKIFALKGRHTGQALPLVAADTRQVEALVGPLSDAASALVAAFWPGPLTLLWPAPAGLAPDVTAGTGRVGVRVPAHAVARALCARAGSPLTATSANLSGEPPSEDPDQVAASIGTGLDLLLDAGTTAGGPPSTIVDASELNLVRAGAVPWARIDACLRQK
jgi:L-threonylcarbamoyladenylate synthase